MKRKIILFLVFLPAAFLKFSVAQQDSYFGNSFTVGTSLTFIPEKDDDGYKLYNEYTWNTNAAMTLSKRLRLGVQVFNIFSDTFSEKGRHFYLTGVFLHYDLFQMDALNYYLGISFNKSNYLLPEFYPYPKEHNTLTYYGFSKGFEVPFTLLFESIPSSLYFDLGLDFFFTLSELPEATNYAIYIFGINYKFGKGLD